MDRANWERPYKAPTILIALGGILGFVNLGIMGMGADVWGAGTLKTGLVFASLIIPVFIYRHYIQDKGSFPKQMLEDLYISGDDTNTSKKAGVLPYVALAAGVLLVWYLHSL